LGRRGRKRPFKGKPVLEFCGFYIAFPKIHLGWEIAFPIGSICNGKRAAAKVPTAFDAKTKTFKPREKQLSF
jgi:hypothetical protein